MNDKSKVTHSGIGMDGAIMPSMQRVFAKNGASVPQMQAIPTAPASQQSSEASAQQHSSTSSNSRK